MSGTSSGSEPPGYLSGAANTAAVAHEVKPAGRVVVVVDREAALIDHPRAPAVLVGVLEGPAGGVGDLAQFAVSRIIAKQVLFAIRQGDRSDHRLRAGDLRRKRAGELTLCFGHGKVGGY